MASKAAKRVLVTGGNKGIGFAICKRLLSKGCFVFLATRSLERGAAAKASLGAEHAKSVELVELDVTSDKSVDAAIAAVKAKCDTDGVKLGAIVCNAGVCAGFSYTTHEDFVTTLAANFDGVVRCTSGFLPLLDDKDPRVVLVSSAAGPNFVAQCHHSKATLLTDPSVRVEQLHKLAAEATLVSAKHAEAGTPPGPEFEAMGLGDGVPYGFSKALVNAYGMHVARENPDVVVSTCTPGMIETDLTRSVADKLGKSVANWGAKTPDDGAVCPVHCALEELPTPRGGAWYWGSDCVRSPLHKYRGPGEPAFDGKVDL